MAAKDGGEDLPQMSGALPDNLPSPNNHSETITLPTIDHIYDERGDSNTPHRDSKKTEKEKKGSVSVVENNHQKERSSSSNSAVIVVENQTQKVLNSKPKPIRRTTTLATTRSTRKRRKPQHRPSLDDVLRYVVNGSVFDRPETQIHLPDSRTSSTTWSEVSIPRDVPKSSLEVILEKGIPPRDPEVDLPASVPLPESRPESLRDPGGGFRGSPSHPSSPPYATHSLLSALPAVKLPVYDYEAILRRATESFQHLKNGRIRAETRHPTLVDGLGYVDLPLSVYGPDRGLVKGNLIGYNPVSFENSIRNVPETVNQRLIIVEDLSPEIIKFLGHRFGVSPEFFEEHLINSGYEGAYYNDPLASTWNTAGMKKSYVSMKWHRPVLRLPEAPFSKQDLHDLLDPDVGWLDYTRHRSNDLSIFQTETNIFRSEWELWTDPKTTTRKRRLCGWEERASVWFQNITNGCQIGMYLTGPPL